MPFIVDIGERKLIKRKLLDENGDVIPWDRIVNIKLILMLGALEYKVFSKENGELISNGDFVEFEITQQQTTEFPPTLYNLKAVIDVYDDRFTDIHTDIQSENPFMEIQFVSIEEEFVGSVDEGELQFSVLVEEIPDEPDIDSVPPNISNTDITPSSVSNTNMQLNFVRGADNVTLQSNLVYTLYRSSQSNISTLSEIDSNGVVVETAEDVGSFFIDELEESTNYTFNVVVEDEAGNRTAYTMITVKTLDEPYINSFVSVEDGEFMLDGEVFRFNGTNAYYLPNYQSPLIGAPDNVPNAFDVFEEAELKIIRMWGFYDGYDYGYSNQDPDETVIQTEAGVYSEQALVYLDEIIAEGKDRGFKFIMPFVNYWNQLGGIFQYNHWAGDSAPTENAMMKFINGSQQQEWFRAYINMLLNRVNTVTGISYKNEPAIMAWEIGNELRCPGANDNGETLRDWYQSMAQYIKGIDPNHLVGTGEEGFDEGTNEAYTEEDYSNTYVLRAEEGTSFILNTAIPEIDFGRAHWYPQVFGFGSVVNNQLLTAQSAFILDRYNISQSYNKPFFVGEWGLDGGWGDEEKMNSMYVPFYRLIEENGISGSLLWQLTADGAKSYEFGGNISWPGGREDLGLFLEYKNHSKIMNGTPSTEPPVIEDTDITIISNDNNNITVSVNTASDDEFPEGLFYELYYSTSDNLDTVANVRLNGTLSHRVAASSNDDIVELIASSLSQDTTYYLNVLAVDIAGIASAYVSVNRATDEGDQTVPTLPVDSEVTLDYELGTVFSISFNEATDPSEEYSTDQENLRYELYISESDNLGSTYASVQSNGTLIATDIGVSELFAIGTEEETTYYCKLVVLDEQNNASLYDDFEVETTYKKVYSIDTEESITDGLLTYMNFNEGRGVTIPDISDVNGVRNATIEGDGGVWVMLNDELVWRKRDNHSEWLTIDHREPELLFSGEAMTIAFEIAFTNSGGDLYYLMYKGFNPGFMVSFPGWTDELRFTYGDIVDSIDASALKDGNLHKIVITVDHASGQATFFVDGSAVGTINLSNQASTPETHFDINLPFISATAGYEVSYSRFGLWNRRLSSAEVFAWMDDPSHFEVEEVYVPPQPGSGEADPPYLIMSLGDSNTADARGRTAMWNRLMTEGYSNEDEENPELWYVGSVQANWLPEAQQYFEAVGGDKIEDVVSKIAQSIITNEPDFISLCIGTNDIFEMDYETAEDMLVAYEEMLDLILNTAADNGLEHMYVSCTSVPPMENTQGWGPYAYFRNDRVDEFNALLEPMIAARVLDGQFVNYVPLNESVIFEDHFDDNVHFNDDGYIIKGEVQAEALIEVMPEPAGGTGDPDPDPGSIEGTHYFTITDDDVQRVNGNNESFFPLQLANSHFWNNVREDGGDIRVSLNDGETQVARAVVNFEAFTIRGYIIFDSSAAIASETTTWRIYYGSNNPEPAFDSTYGRNAVWDNTAGVWSMSDLLDMSGNGNDLTAFGSPSLAVGQLSVAYDLDGSTNYFTAPHDDSLNLYNNFALQMWVNHNNTDGDGEEGLINKHGSSFGLLLDDGHIRTGIGNAGWVTGTEILPTGWINITFTQGDQSDRLYYVNGQFFESVPSTGMGTNTNELSIGSWTNGDILLEGQVELVRVVTVQRSAEWIEEEHSIQSDPGNFWTISDEIEI